MRKSVLVSSFLVVVVVLMVVLFQVIFRVLGSWPVRLRLDRI